jgi:peptide methionine sulfoxide reductase MsrB
VYLTDQQFYVTQDKHVDDPMDNMTNFHEEGIYHCVICDQKVFSSKHKIKDINYTMLYPRFSKTIGNVTLDDAPFKKFDPVTGVKEMRCGNCSSFFGDYFNDTEMNLRDQFEPTTLAFPIIYEVNPSSVCFQYGK